MIRVVHVCRKPQTQNYSVEGLFHTVRRHLPPDIAVEVAVAPWPSRGVSRRVRNTLWARRLREDGLVPHVTGDILYVAPALGPATIVTIHDLGWVARGGVSQAIFEALWFRLPVRTVCAVTTDSAFIRGELLRRVGCPSHRVHVVPCCYDPVFTTAPEHYHAERPVVLAVGTTANKNIERLCAALEGLRCELHVVGPLSPSQRTAVSRHHIQARVSVGIAQDAIVAAYHEADIVAFPSWYEGFGLPIIEGQICGRPVLTSRAASMPEVAGAGACLIDPLDVSSIRTGLRRIMDSADYRAELRTLGLENVRRFAPTTVAEQFATLYRAVAATS